jgi:hypothetical protein
VPTTIISVYFVTRHWSNVLVETAFRLRPAVSNLRLGHGSMRSAVFSGRLCRRACQLLLQAAALGFDSLPIRISAKLLQPRAHHLRCFLGCCCDTFFQMQTPAAVHRPAGVATTRTLVGRVTANFCLKIFTFMTILNIRSKLIFSINVNIIYLFCPYIYIYISHPPFVAQQQFQ